MIEKAGTIHAEMPAIIQIAVEMAMRRSELLGLRRENVKAKHVLLEDTKNGTRRLVLPPRRGRSLTGSRRGWMAKCFRWRRTR